jgi:hypothetical protein
MRPHAPAGGPDPRPHRLRYPDARMDRDERLDAADRHHPAGDPDGVVYRLNFAEPALTARPGDRLTVTLGPGGEHAFTLTTADRGPLAAGVLSHLNFHVVAVAAGSGEPPVRPLEQPEPQPEPEPDGDPFARTWAIGAFARAADAAPAGPRHTHRHAHHGDPGAPPGRLLPPTERYEHTHPHAHAKRRNDRSYHTDHQH